MSTEIILRCTPWFWFCRRAGFGFRLLQSPVIAYLKLFFFEFIHTMSCNNIKYSTTGKILDFRLALNKQKERSYFRHTIYFDCRFGIRRKLYHMLNFKHMLSEPRCEQTGFLHLRKQRRRSASP